MEFGSVFWWNFWMLVNVLIVAGFIVAVALFIRWGRRKSANTDVSEAPLDHS